MARSPALASLVLLRMVGGFGIFLCRQFISNCSLATIGAEIGGKDHATVLHSCNTVSDLMSTDKVFRKYVNDIEEMLTSSQR